MTENLETETAIEPQSTKLWKVGGTSILTVLQFG
jgi:hypothetical protein